MIYYMYILYIYIYSACFTDLERTTAGPGNQLHFKSRDLDTAFVGLIFDDKLLHPWCSACVSVLPLLIHMGQRKIDVSFEDT